MSALSTLLLLLLLMMMMTVVSVMMLMMVVVMRPPPLHLRAASALPSSSLVVLAACTWCCVDACCSTSVQALRSARDTSRVWTWGGAGGGQRGAQSESHHGRQLKVKGGGSARDNIRWGEGAQLFQYTPTSSHCIDTPASTHCIDTLTIDEKHTDHTHASCSCSSCPYPTPTTLCSCTGCKSVPPPPPPPPPHLLLLCIGTNTHTHLLLQLLYLHRGLVCVRLIGGCLLGRLLVAQPQGVPLLLQLGHGLGGCVWGGGGGAKSQPGGWRG